MSQKLSFLKTITGQIILLVTLFSPFFIDHSAFAGNRDTKRFGLLYHAYSPDKGSLGIGYNIGKSFRAKIGYGSDLSKSTKFFNVEGNWFLFDSMFSPYLGLAYYGFSGAAVDSALEGSQPALSLGLDLALGIGLNIGLGSVYFIPAKSGALTLYLGWYF